MTVFHAIDIINLKTTYVYEFWTK